MLYKVGSIAISDLAGVDENTQQRLRDVMEKANKNTKKTKKR
ncbi:hypothetical protein [Maridesulfovibrio sp.]|nr:hypothetical protein [Maridesulfovibrio sp.]